MDPELEAFAALLPKPDISDVVAARAQQDQMAEALDPALMARLEIEDRRVGDTQVPVRVYRPKAESELPALLWIHGGGFALGSIETTHVIAALLADLAGALVVSVGYRLAPEHPFPAGLDDCYGALRWLAGEAAELGVDRDRIAIGGPSAGGGLAAGLALRARDEGGPAICYQLLLIPELDDRLDTPSMKAFTDTPGWNRPNAVLSWQYYLNGAKEVSPYAAPARATDLSGLPPAYVTTAELDPLRDEGIRYALRMLQAGVPVELHQYAGTFHGSQLISEASISKRQSAETITVLRRALGSEG